MKQLLQRLNTGETILIDSPVPAVSGPNIVVETRATTVSAGTERMLVEFGRANLLDKARSQPEKVRQVLDKVRTDGVMPTLDAVRAKLDAPIPLGYCNAGVVRSVGNGVRGFAVGDRVVTNGAHAEFVRVPHTLAAKIPDGVSFEAASFTPIAAIGLQGVRLAEPTLGETVVVFGLGLIGLLTVQLLRANGCRVIGIDRDPKRLALAESFGADPIHGGDSDAVASVLARTGGVGADAVLLTLASEADEPIRQAAAMSRKRGRLVLVGTTGLSLSRDEFFKKELTFSVSCSYGPGRYDPSYEDQGRDYPLAYVRWTEQRNFETVLALMQDGKVDPLPLITHRFTFDHAPEAYDLLSGSAPSLGIILQYPEQAAAVATERTLRKAPAGVAGKGTVGVIGAGNFAVRTLLPLLRAENARLHTIVSSGGVNGSIAAEKFGFEHVSTDVQAIIDNPEIDTVFLLTRHDSHASLAKRALEAGKHVFVEKPLALTETELTELEEVARRSNGLLTVGFNRRFAPLTREATARMRGRAGPVSVILTVNAGAIPRDHWTQDPETGGGRIVGEGCHFIDLARALVGAPIENVQVTSARDRDGRPVDDISHISIGFSDGSTATVHYLASGASSYPKERVECFFDGRVLVIENWRRLREFGPRAPWRSQSSGMDKGHAQEIREWFAAIRSGASTPIPLDELVEVSRWSIHAAELARGPEYAGHA